MAGYVAPRYITNFPEGGDRAEVSYAGSSGYYWIELTCQRNPILCRQWTDFELQCSYIGDSAIVVGSPTERDHEKVAALELNQNRNISVYKNSDGRLSHLSVRAKLRNFEEAFLLADTELKPFLSLISYQYNLPVSECRVRALEEATRITRTRLPLTYFEDSILNLTERNPQAWWVPREHRFLTFYREALLSTSPSLQFLCFFKAVERVFEDRRVVNESTFKIEERRVKRKPEIFNPEEWLRLQIHDEVLAKCEGKKFTRIVNDVLRPLRAQAAHAFLEDSDNEPGAEDELVQHLPVLKLIAHSLCGAQLIETSTGRATSARDGSENSPQSAG